MLTITDRPEVDAELPQVRPPPNRLDRRPLLTTIVAVAVLATIAVGVWLLTTWGSGGAGPDDILVVDEAGTISLLDAQTGEVVYEVADAVVSPDRSALLSTRPADAGGGTTVERRDASTGAVVHEATLPGDQEIRIVSPHGDAVVLMARRDPSLGLYEPESRASTELTIAYLDTRRSVSLTLPGNFEPETFSVDEQTLYLLQYEPALAPEHYLVVELDIGTGEIEAVRSPQVDIQPEMRGVARAQAVAPGGDHLYTLYTTPPDADPVHDVADTVSSERWAFVHVLNVDEGYDFCIFLPVPMGTVNEASLGVGLSPDGRTLYVVDPSTATVARIDTELLEITAVYHVPAIEESDLRPGVAVGNEGRLYVGFGNVIHAFQPGTEGMVRMRSIMLAGTISGVDLSASGGLRVAHQNEIVSLDPLTLESELVIQPSGSGSGSVEILSRTDTGDVVGRKIW